MAYTKTTWVDDNAPAINASNLNKIETGIFDVHKMIVAEGQIKFPATQVPSADPNTLDDYEEGNWTPVLSNAIGCVPLITQAIYTKIGRHISAQCYVTIDNQSGSNVETYTIGGLPFVARNHGFCSQYFQGGYANRYIEKDYHEVNFTQTLTPGTNFRMMYFSYITD